jgi:SAM-dependent methyltransferase
MKKYSKKFLTVESVNEYESQEYSPEGYAAKIWSLQKPFLGEILNTHKHKCGGLRLLDFACGTGRVLSYFETITTHSDGLDISETMVKIARQRCPKSRLYVADICNESVVQDASYDVITSFRFLLNAEAELRITVLHQLRKRIDENHGILIVNVHGNRSSARHLPIMIRRLRAKLNPKSHEDVMMAEMGLSETRSLLADTGFKVIREIGFGILPSFFYRGILRPICYWLDSKFCGSGITSRFSTDVIFVCVPV